MSTLLFDRPPPTTSPSQPEAAPGLLPRDRRVIDALVARANRRAERQTDVAAAAPSPDPETLRWIPLAVPLLGVMICVSMLMIWSML